MQQGTPEATVYGVKYQARCITPLAADIQHTRFLVGTLSLREENEVHLIQYSGTSGSVICEGGEYGASLWKMPDLAKNSSHLQQLAPLNSHTNKIKSILWWPGGRHNQLLSIDEEMLYLWSIDASGKSAKVEAQLSAGLLYHMVGGAWDPHDAYSVATACESSIQCWDLRTMKQTQVLEHAQVRDVDFNPNKQHFLATAGDDSKIRIWDKRMSGTYVQELSGHSHWIWKVRHNPKVESFLLSCGTDSVINLWLLDSFETVEDRTKSPDDSPRAQYDPLLKSYNGHEDSIYGIAWSSKEPWIFASISYDGRVLVNSIPQALSKTMKIPTTR